MNYEKIRRYADLVTVIIGASLLSYLFFKHVFVYILPFLIGWFLAFTLRPPARYIARRLRMKERIVRLLLTILLILSLFAALALAVWLLSREVWELLAGIGSGDSSLDEFIHGVTSAEGVLGRLFGNFGSYVSDAIYSVLASMLNSLGSFLSGAVSVVPRALLFLLVSVIASAYFAVGLEEVNAAVKRILPSGTCEILVKIKDGFISSLMKYLRSYLLLLVITFFEMLVGLLLLRAPYPLVVAIVIAILDLLPIVGVGAVLIPWSVWSLCIGKTAFGVGLAVLFVFHAILREVIEPKIIGKNLGMHPLLTLVFIYLGYSLFGVVGIILVPVFTVLVNIVFDKNNTAEVTKGTVGKGDNG